MLSRQGACLLPGPFRPLCCVIPQCYIFAARVSKNLIDSNNKGYVAISNSDFPCTRDSDSSARSDTDPAGIRGPDSPDSSDLNSTGSGSHSSHPAWWDCLEIGGARAEGGIL